MADHQVRLKRELTLWPLVLLTLAYMSPLVGVAYFGTVAELSAGTTALAYSVTTVAMVLTALSYGHMARRFPMAGSAYTYVRRALDSRLGFLVGWAVLLDYFFIPMVAWLVGAIFLNTALPELPLWACLLALIVPTTIINLIGIKLVAIINYIFFGFAVVVIVIWSILCVRYAVSREAFTSADLAAPFWNKGSSLSAVMSGGALAAISFLGFDACTTLSEETHNAQKTVPRAVLLSCLIGGAILVISTYAGQLVHPGGVFADSASGAIDVAKAAGGSLLKALIISGVVVSQFLCCTVMQASASRLLYAMGRDGVFPKVIFARLSKRFHTPWLNILITVVASAPAFIYSLATTTSFVNFGAFTAFTFVNIGVIGLVIREKSLRRKAWPIVLVLLPALGALVNVYLLLNLDMTAIRLGLIWMAIGVVALAVITKGFRVAPPEMSFTEEEAILEEREDESGSTTVIPEAAQART